MRRFLLLALCVGCSASTASIDPLDWQKVTGSATDTGLANGGVLGLGAGGAFDQRANFTVDAFPDGNLIRMYYGGADSDQADPGCGGINGVHWRIGVATSTDGLNFTRVAGAQAKGSILENGAAGDFDSFLTYRPNVLKDGTVYRMWYNGSTKPFNCPTGTLALDRRIGYAESTDGVNFTKINTGPGPGGSVLPLGNPGAIDAQQVGYVWVLKDANDYKMYYSANDNQNFWRIGLATSKDARTWTKVVGKQNGGAVVDIGDLSTTTCSADADCASLTKTPVCSTSVHLCTAPDHFCAYQPTVVKETASLYRMWYRGCQGPGNPNGPSLGSIQYAESNDGITWVKVPQNGKPLNAALVAGPSGSFDSGGLTTPSVFFQNGAWNMYYAGFDVTGQYSAGLARATGQ
ncbi:MAG TPA: hypothetical protein VGH20_03750 [Myxococcales bacterium]|jgi:hypothetical protein